MCVHSNVFVSQPGAIRVFHHQGEGIQPVSVPLWTHRVLGSGIWAKADDRWSKYAHIEVQFGAGPE